MRYVELRVPCANGAQGYVGKNASNKIFSLPALPHTSAAADRSESKTLSRTQVRGGRANRLAYRGVAPALRGKRKLSLPPYRWPIQARTTRYSIVKSHEGTKGWDPSRISPQRLGNGSTLDTRTRVGSAEHRATIVPPPKSRHLRSIEKKQFAPPPPSLSAGGATIRRQRGRSIICSQRGDSDMLRRGTPLFHPHGVVVRRVSIKMFEGCRKQTKEPPRTTPPKLQPTVGHDPFMKTVNTGAPPHCTLT